MLVILLLYLPGCDRPGGPQGPRGAAPGDSGEAAAGPESTVGLDANVRRFCGGCHGMPAPGSFPRDAWFKEVNQGFDFYYASGRDDLEPPPMNDVVVYFRDRAPDRLEVPPLPVVDWDAPIAFRREQIAGVAPPGIAHIRWWTPEDQHPCLLTCDMRGGEVRKGSWNGNQFEFELLSRLSHPAHVHPTDLNGDGAHDFVIAELGSFEPADHDRGRVVWLHRIGGTDEWQQVSLLQGVGRVADVRSADFDGDGDLDLVVAEFGWRASGRILLMERDGWTEAGAPAFTTHVLDDRHGTIHVPVCDLNRDGRSDFVALVSQEHESVDAFLGRGDGTFDRQRIHAAGDPSYGSSGIQLVDLDADGDLDVLYTNGDTLDSFHLKPFHSIQWLENTGNGPFVRHEVLRMPGVYRAVAADMDGDGDLDIVACAYFMHAGELRDSELDRAESLVWIEQFEPGRFRRHPLTLLQHEGFMTLEVGDFDNDGRPDIATGHFVTPSDPRTDSLSIWWNQSKE